MRRFKSYRPKCKKMLFAAVVLCLPFMGLGQNICREVLSMAEKEFEAGHLYQAPELLRTCLGDGFTKEENVRAYRLLTIAYLLLDEPIKAERAYISLLKLNPMYAPNVAIDPSELIFFHKNFNTQPRWSIQPIKAGLNLTFIKPFNYYSTDGLLYHDAEGLADRQTAKKYMLSVGYTIGTGVDYMIWDKLSLSTEILLSLHRFKLDETLFRRANFTYKEEQYNIQIPVFVKYTFINSKLKPYLYGGAGVKILLFSAAKNLSIIKDNAALPETGPEISIDDNRNRLGYDFLVGGGLKYKLGVNYLTFDLRQSFGLNNVSSRESRYANKELLYKYMHVDDDMRMNHSLITIGFVKPVYNPLKKIK